MAEKFTTNLQHFPKQSKSIRLIKIYGNPQKQKNCLGFPRQFLKEVKKFLQLKVNQLFFNLRFSTLQSSFQMICYQMNQIRIGRYKR